MHASHDQRPKRLAGISGRIGAWRVLLLLPVLTASIAPGGLVLCVAEDDHVAVELAYEPLLCGAAGPTSTDFSVPLPLEDCADTRILSIQSTVDPNPRSVALAHLNFDTLAVLNSRHPNDCRVPRSEGIVAQHAQRLHSTILRI